MLANTRATCGAYVSSKGGVFDELVETRYPLLFRPRKHTALVMSDEDGILPYWARNDCSASGHVLNGFERTLALVPFIVLERHEPDIHFCKIRDEVYVGLGVHVLDDCFPVFR